MLSSLDAAGLSLLSLHPVWWPAHSSRDSAHAYRLGAGNIAWHLLTDPPRMGMHLRTPPALILDQAILHEDPPGFVAGDLHCLPALGYTPVLTPISLNV